MPKSFSVSFKTVLVFLDIWNVSLKHAKLLCIEYVTTYLISAAAGYDEVVLTGLTELEIARRQHEPVALACSGMSQQCWTIVPAQNVRAGFDGIGGLADAKQALLEMVVWPARYVSLSDVSINVVT
jgi:hypothetical protein